MAKPFLSEIEALAGVRISGDNTPLILDFDDGSVAFEASIFADSDGTSKELRLVVDGKIALLLGEDEVTLMAGGFTAAKTMFDSGTGDSGFILYGDGSVRGHLVGSADTNVILSSDGGLKLRPGGLANPAREIMWTGSSTAPQFRDAGGTMRDLAYIRTGSLSPTIEGSGSNPTVSYSLSVGTYLRIGSLVFVSGRITVSSISGGSGNLRIGSLPFACGGFARFRAPLFVTVSGINYLTLTMGNVFAMPPISASYLDIFVYTSNGTYQNLALSNVGNGDDIMFSGFYWTQDS